MRLPRSVYGPIANNYNYSGNRFTSVFAEELSNGSASFKGIRELALEENLLSWSEIVTIASHFPDLTTLLASSNQIQSLTPIPPSSSLLSSLTSLSLEFNDLTSISSLSPLTSLTSLRNLHLKGNNISTILSPSLPPDHQPPVFPHTLTYLDLSSNSVSTWSFIDQLPTSFPGLQSLRFAHNPIYTNPDLDSPSPAPEKPAKGTEESYMLLTARLPSLKALNFSTITPQDRANADMFYLSRIARQLSSVPAENEADVLARHPRYAELCARYGAPAVSRTREVDPRFLEGRLVSVTFQLGAAEKTVGVPKSFDVYAVKGVVGRLFGLAPLGTKLVWETGEWDPVGGFDEEGDSSEDEEAEVDKERREDGVVVEDGERGGEGGVTGGRWVKREVELRDGPRQFGYCVDGMEARIRVEVVTTG